MRYNRLQFVVITAVLLGSLLVSATERTQGVVGSSGAAIPARKAGGKQQKQPARVAQLCRKRSESSS